MLPFLPSLIPLVFSNLYNRKFFALTQQFDFNILKVSPKISKLFYDSLILTFLNTNGGKSRLFIIDTKSIYIYLKQIHYIYYINLNSVFQIYF